MIFVLVFLNSYPLCSQIGCTLFDLFLSPLFVLICAMMGKLFSSVPGGDWDSFTDLFISGSQLTPSVSLTSSCLVTHYQLLKMFLKLQTAAVQVALFFTRVV